MFGPYRLGVAGRPLLVTLGEAGMHAPRAGLLDLQPLQQIDELIAPVKWCGPS